ncbi:MAG TPA: MAPEG family protein [Xanthomonadaceae bacterium]|nr:MAPEG family protein [Xanthomonadaceae bacterium]
MTIAYWCILAAAFLPYVWTVIAKRSGERYDNRDPRGWLSRQQNPVAIRANAAQLNAFEAFAPFAAGVLMAQFADVDAGTVTLLSLAFVGFRILHGVAYLGGWHYLRSMAWAAGYLCVLALMVLAAAAVQ